MPPQNFDNIDEQLQKLEVICHEATRKYELYLDEFETKTKNGVEITQDLIDKLDKAVKDQKKAVDNQDTFIVFCSKNKLDLTAYWARIGFSEKEIQKMVEEDKN